MIEKLLTVVGVEPTLVTLSVATDWHHDELSTLYPLILEHLPEARVIELIYGADRLSVRFDFQLQHFVLQFECYSHSVWIEAEDATSNNGLAKVAQLIADSV